MAYKCPKTLGNKGLSGTLCFEESDAATLLQHAIVKAQKGIVTGGYEVKKGDSKDVCNNP